MKKKTKIILAATFSVASLVGISTILASCASVHDFQPPKYIEIDNKVLEELDKFLVPKTARIQGMKSEDEMGMIATVQQEIYDQIIKKYPNELKNVSINVDWNSSTQKYEFFYEIFFKFTTNINFNVDTNKTKWKYIEQEQKIISEGFALNEFFNQNSTTAYLWIDIAQSIPNNTYILLKNEPNQTLNFELSSSTFNTQITKGTNIKIQDLQQINIFINQVVNITNVTNWISTQITTPIQVPKTINVNIKYNQNNNPNLVSNQTITNNNLTIQVVATANAK